MRRSRKPVWAFAVHRGFESLPLRSRMASVGQPQALPVAGRRPSAVAVLDLVRRGLGLVALGGLLYCASVTAAGTGYRPTRVVPAGTGGSPDWLRGPLADLGWVLPIHDFAVYVTVMLGCFLV